MIIVFLYSGVKRTGKLPSVNDEGIEMDGRQGLVAWKDVLSIGLAP